MPRFNRTARRLAVGAVLTAVPLGVAGAVIAPTASQAGTILAGTTLKAPDGTPVGSVLFTVTGDTTRVFAHLSSRDALGATDAFHGFHIHANNDPANGAGCVADPGQPSTTWFTSADGHLSAQGQTHGAHHGDMPSLLVNADGTADLSFTTGRLELADLRDRAVVVHAKPDNFGNIPLGTGPEDYRANSPAGPTKTGATGNAGDRLACGTITVLEAGRG
jgi:superoxide dismutase, Cu-Zn family